MPLLAVVQPPSRVELGPVTLVMQARAIGLCTLRRAGSGRVDLAADNVVTIAL
jgi:hypothetical protein